MLWNYFVSTYRNLRKNRLFAAINILGLSIGLLVFVSSQLVAQYEANYDTFFRNADRTYVVSASFDPARNFSGRFTTGVQTPFAPLIRENVPAAEVTARTYLREFLAETGDKLIYQPMRFVDDGFLEIFDFEYISGSSETALSDPSGLILTESTARKFFGEENPMGQTVTLDKDHDLRVTAIIRDLPRNTHFNSYIIFRDDFDAIATSAAFVAITGYDTEGAWGNQSSDFVTYTMLREGATVAEADQQLADLFEKYAPDDGPKEYMTSLFLTPLVEMNLSQWMSAGVPVMLSIQLLGVLVLAIAALNYTNLATAQAIGRMREVALRKTMGASRKQLFSQFIAESVLVALIAFVVAVAMIDIILPMANGALNKNLDFGMLATPIIFARLFLIVLGVGVLAGAYPAYLIAKGRTVEMLHENTGKKRGGNWVRSTLLVLQFTISIFIAIAVSIIYSQNLRVAETSAVFPKDQVLVLERMTQGNVKESWGPLKTELERIPGVEAVSFVSYPPFEQSSSSTSISVEPGDEAGKFSMSYISMDESFLAALEMPLLAGRNLSEDIATDRYHYNEEGHSISPEVNVLVNETALNQTGATSPEDAIGKTFYSMYAEPFRRQYTIVGVVPDINYRGFQSNQRPLMFAWIDNWKFNTLIRISAGSSMNVISDIDRVWSEILPAYPIERRLLNDMFEERYQIFQVMNGILASFGLIALMLALFGLFGLAAIMAASRTKEIGVRKVLGANTPDIVRLLVWQFSRPVVIGFVLAIPLGYLGAQSYLNFFADRISMTPAPFLLAGLLALGLAWATVAGHAIRVARANPINALRWE